MQFELDKCGHIVNFYKKFSYLRGTVRCAVLICFCYVS